MGDAIASPADQKVKFTIKMTELEGAHPEVIQDGEATTLIDAAAVQGKEEVRSFDYTSDGKRHWLRINIRSVDGSLLIAGNPIYLNF
jgi:hypothetical protein